MKHKNQPQQILSIKAQIRNGRFSVTLSLPTRWVYAIASIAGALLSSTPIIKFLEILAQLSR